MALVNYEYELYCGHLVERETYIPHSSLYKPPHILKYFWLIFVKLMRIAHTRDAAYIKLSCLNKFIYTLSKHIFGSIYCIYFYYFLNILVQMFK